MWWSIDGSICGNVSVDRLLVVNAAFCLWFLYEVVYGSLIVY